MEEIRVPRAQTRAKIAAIQCKSFPSLRPKSAARAGDIIDLAMAKIHAPLAYNEKLSAVGRIGSHKE